MHATDIDFMCPVRIKSTKQQRTELLLINFGLRKKKQLIFEQLSN